MHTLHSKHAVENEQRWKKIYVAKNSETKIKQKKNFQG